MSGTLYGIGLGPGDPELVTLKAMRLMRAAAVVAYPVPDGGTSLARQIAAPYLSETQTELEIPVPMRTERGPAQEAYDEAAKAIALHLDGGQDVALLCEGDPFFYGSFMYLHARLAGRFPVEIVPGVSSPAACTAAAARPLCARNEALTILPAPLPDTELRARLARTDAAIVIKLGRHLPRLRRLLDELGLSRRTLYVRHASLPQQEVLALADAPEVAPYFSMLLIPGSDPHAT